jgi:hypothetical protein
MAAAMMKVPAKISVPIFALNIFFPSLVVSFTPFYLARGMPMGRKFVIQRNHKSIYLCSPGGNQNIKFLNATAAFILQILRSPSINHTP